MQDVYYSQDGLLVIQKPPCTRTIFVYKKNGAKPYHLAFPWQIYAISYQGYHFYGLQLAFRNEPLSENDKQLFYPHLYNVGDTLGVCLGNTNFVSQTLEDLVQQVLSSLWSSEWNKATHECYQEGNYYSSDKRLSKKNGNPDWKKW